MTPASTTSPPARPLARRSRHRPLAVAGTTGGMLLAAMRAERMTLDRSAILVRTASAAGTGALLLAAAEPPGEWFVPSHGVGAIGQIAGRLTR